jgi:hypothetical protein
LAYRPKTDFPESTTIDSDLGWCPTLVARDSAPLRIFDLHRFSRNVAGIGINAFSRIWKPSELLGFGITCGILVSVFVIVAVVGQINSLTRFVHAKIIKAKIVESIDRVVPHHPIKVDAPTFPDGISGWPPPQCSQIVPVAVVVCAFDGLHLVIEILRAETVAVALRVCAGGTMFSAFPPKTV